MTELEKNQYLENKERRIVLNTCYEIGLSINPYSFYNLFKSELNDLAFIGVEYKDFKKLSSKINNILSDKKFSQDEFFLENELIFDILNEIGSIVKTSVFLHSFGHESNNLSYIGVSDDKYNELSEEIKLERELIEFECQQLVASKPKQYTLMS